MMVQQEMARKKEIGGRVKGDRGRITLRKTHKQWIRWIKGRVSILCVVILSL